MASKFYRVRGTKKIEGKEWCLFDWEGFWAEGSFKSIFKAISDSLGDEFRYSKDTKAKYILKSSLNKLDGVLLMYEQDFSPNGAEEARKFDAAFGAEAKPKGDVTPGEEFGGI